MTTPCFFDDETQLAPPRTVRIDRDDGSFLLRSPVALRPYARCIGEWLERWARETPDKVFLAILHAALAFQRGYIEELTPIGE